MARKTKASPAADDQQLAEAVRASAQQIWQAGLGAFARAQEEGGKVFSKLVKEGTALQKRRHALADDKVSGVSDTVSRIAGSVSRQASGSWDKLEQVFEDRVARSLARLGVPTAKDIQALHLRIEALDKTLAAWEARHGSAARSPAAKKAAAKPASAKKSASKAATARKAPAKAATRKAAARKNTGAP